MNEQGKVIRTEGNIAVVEIEKSVACGYCHACEGSAESKNTLKAVNDIGAKKGDKVQLTVSESRMVFLAFLLYILPLFVFVLAYLIGDGLARKFSVNTDVYILSGTATAGLSLLFYYLGMRGYDRRYKDRFDHKPRLIQIIK